MSTLKRYRELYGKADQKERSRLLDQLCELTQHYRKYPISFLGEPPVTPAQALPEIYVQAPSALLNRQNHAAMYTGRWRRVQDKHAWERGPARDAMIPFITRSVHPYTCLYSAV